MEPIRNDESKEPFSKDELDVLKQARNLEDMVRTPGWKLLEELTQTRLSEYSAELMGEVRKDYNVERDIWLKGALYGLQYFLGLPSVVIAQAREMRSERMAPEIGDEE